MSEEKKTWYDPKHLKAQYAYNKRSIKRVPFEMQKSYYEGTLKPFVDSLGLPMNTFIRQAVEHEIQRLQEENK